MVRISRIPLSLLLVPVAFVSAQQLCYFGPGAEYRGPDTLVPCQSSGNSACCLLGDTCLSGNACYNFAYGNVYQYGCTDINYEDETCPYKCGWNATESPWTALEYCSDDEEVDNTWTCHSPESCGCDWQGSYGMLKLEPRQCKAMGDEARVALYAPSDLAPWVSLPTELGGSTGYYQGTTIDGESTWVDTAINGYTPAAPGPLTTYATPAPNKVVLIHPSGTPSPATLNPATALSATSSFPRDTSITYVSPTGSSSSAPSNNNNDNGNSNNNNNNNGATSSTGSAAETASTTAAAASSGLTTGTKVGIGVGIAGGVALVAAIVLVFFVLRKRRNREKPQDPDYQAGYNEKHSWQSQDYSTGAAAGGYYDPRQSTSPYLGSSTMIHEPYTTGEEETIRKHVSVSPPLPPMELDAGFRRSEMDSQEGSPARQPQSPAPPYRPSVRSQRSR